MVVNGVRPPLGPSTGPNPRPGPESPVGSSSRCRRKLLSSFPVSDKNICSADIKYLRMYPKTSILCSVELYIVYCRIVYCVL